MKPIKPNPAYQRFTEELRNCSVCIFRNTKILPLIPPFIPAPVSILFIGENPSWAENQEKPFASSTISGKALDDHYLKPLGLNRNEVWITDLFKCRYPKDIYHVKNKNEQLIQSVATTCARLWLVQEILLAKPKIIITLAAKEVYNRFCSTFDLDIHPNFSNSAGKPHPIEISGFQTTLFPMVHPDVSRPVGDGDNRKLIVRQKWAPIHSGIHIPKLQKLLNSIN